MTGMMMRDTITAELDKHLQVLTHIRDDNGINEQIIRVAEEIVRCFRCGGKVLVFGCGGSAADSQHIAKSEYHRYERDCILGAGISTDD